MRYWLMKSEPDVFGIDDLAPRRAKTTAWFGVRNYQARNFMRDQMQRRRPGFFYHSSCPRAGHRGHREGLRAWPIRTTPSSTARANTSTPRRRAENPRWFNVDVKLVRKTRLSVSQELRDIRSLRSMRVLQRGNRLSITPVDPAEWKFILRLIDA